MPDRGLTRADGWVHSRIAPPGPPGMAMLAPPRRLPDAVCGMGRFRLVFALGRAGARHAPSLEDAMPAFRFLAVPAAVAMVLSLSACGDKEGKGGAAAPEAAAPAAGQPVATAVARVNGTAITQTQLTAVLPDLAQAPEAQVKAASRQALERLVDQQLLVQKALEGKLDADPQVAAALENARREVLARAYAARLGSTVAVADETRVKAFYDEHPELFAQRRIYRLQEALLRLDAAGMEKAKAALPGMRTLQDVMAFARANDIRVGTNTQVRPAEQLPMELAKLLAGKKDGEIVAFPGPGGISVVQVAGSQAQPLDLEKAKPFILKYLQNRAAADLTQNEVKTLRAAAKVEYLGEFASAAPEAAPAAASPAPAQPPAGQR